MADFWIADAKERVLGPMRWEVLEDLITTGRISGIVRVSIDAQTWVPVQDFPAIAAAQEAHRGDARRERDVREATRRRGELERLRTLQPHEVFGIAPGAPLAQWRACFFRLVKQFYPERLDPQYAPELHQVNVEIFVFLSGLMAFIERNPPAPNPLARGSDAGPRPQTPPPALARASGPQVALNDLASNSALRDSGPRPAAMPASGRRRESADTERMFTLTPIASDDAKLELANDPPTYAMSEFVGLDVRADDLLQVTVTVAPETCWIFTDDSLFNLSRGGAFIPCPHALKMGTRVEVLFRFEAPARVVTARGLVASWNAGDGKRPRGFGVQFVRQEKADLAFLQDYVARFGMTARVRERR